MSAALVGVFRWAVKSVSVCVFIAFAMLLSDMCRANFWGIVAVALMLCILQRKALQHFANPLRRNQLSL